MTARKADRTPTPEGPVVTHRVPWWRCGAVYIPSLQQWSGAMFRAHFRVAGLPHCAMLRWHRGDHYWEYETEAMAPPLRSRNGRSANA